jgi:hypothetical protein
VAFSTSATVLFTAAMFCGLGGFRALAEGGFLRATRRFPSLDGGGYFVIHGSFLFNLTIKALLHSPN